MNVINFKEINSTNTYGKENINILEDKTIISADFQTNGYGRFERSWMDMGSENIYMTFVLKPSKTLSQVHACLTQYLSVCLCKLIEDIGLEPKIKWPNDVLLNDKKVCGILAETVMRGGKLQGIALGIGVNLNTSQAMLDKIDRPATSLNIELGHNLDKQAFMQKLIEEFFENYDEFLRNGFAMIKDYYEKHASFLNQNLTISIFNSTKEGIFKGLDENGALILAMPDGKCESINMGEIV